jgi:type IV pilus assembly protein PilB
MTNKPLHVVQTATPPPGVTPPSGATGRRLREVLVDLGLVTDEQIAGAVEVAEKDGRPFERVLLEHGAISPEQLARAVAERYGLAYLDMTRFAVDRAAAELLDQAIETRHAAVPVMFLDQNTILVAMADPANTPALSEIETRTRLRARPAVASPEAIARVIADEEPAEDNVVELREAEPAFELARALLAEAAARGASAVHIEPQNGTLRARARVGRALVPLPDVPQATLGAIKRLERGRYELGERTVEVAVSVLSTSAGESAVVRLRDPAAPRPGLDELDLRRPELERALATGRGVVVIAGTSADDRDIAIDAVTRAATTPERRVVVADGDVADALAADPDVVVVPAVRDRESAKAALDAALDGVLVIAGVPAPDPERARLRMHGWGVEPFLIEHAIACVVGVRPDTPGPG